MGWITLTDLSPMPIGKYKGTPMQDVPADYLHYLWHHGMKQQTGTNSVAAYIKQSLHVLKTENPDLIWD
jgi:uncharacterized protein (DUF3820 family)